MPGIFWRLKQLLDPHIIKLSTHESKELCKQVLETVKDPDCKFLRPNESETESSDEDFLVNFKRPVEEQIFANFPEGTLTPEMQTHIEKHDGLHGAGSHCHCHSPKRVEKDNVYNSLRSIPVVVAGLCATCHQAPWSTCQTSQA